VIRSALLEEVVGATSRKRPRSNLIFGNPKLE